MHTHQNPEGLQQLWRSSNKATVNFKHNLTLFNPSIHPTREILLHSPMLYLANSCSMCSPVAFDLTVIINVYNGEATLKRAIDSILSQSVKPTKLIIWDNQSTDRTKFIASSYPEVDYFLSEVHTSLGHARELARQHANTLWIAYLDADDYWYQDKLLEQARSATPDDLCDHRC